MPPATSKSKGWFTVPDPVRVIFDNFPLQTYPAAPIPPSITFACNDATLESKKIAEKKYERSVTLYSYNLLNAKTSNNTEFLFPTDPASIQILGFLRLKNIKLSSIDGESGPIRLLAVSPHSAPRKGGLPYLIDISSNPENITQRTRAVYSTLSAVYRNLLAPVPQGEPALYQSMISNVLHDAWVLMLIDPETELSVRQKILGEGPYRVPKASHDIDVETEKANYYPLPQFVENYLVECFTLELIEQLKPRYPAVTELLNSYSWRGLNFIPFGFAKFYQKNLISFFASEKGQSICEEIYSRTVECLKLFEKLIMESESKFLGIGDPSNVNEDVREFKEDKPNIDGGLGPLDISLFAYVHSILQYAENTRLQKMISMEFPELVKHSEKVYGILF